MLHHQQQTYRVKPGCTFRNRFGQILPEGSKVDPTPDELRGQEHSLKPIAQQRATAEPRKQATR
jgi:hypothetical protein